MKAIVLVTMPEQLPRDALRRLEAAQGYVDLHMGQEAWEELESIGPPFHRHRIVRLARVDIRMRQGRWKDGYKLADALLRDEPDHYAAYISRSFCLHCLDQTRQARDRLLEAPRGIEQVPTYHYNLACYACQLGEVDSARGHLARAIHMADEFAKLAATDPDLEALWPELSRVVRQARSLSKEPDESVRLRRWAEALREGEPADRRNAMEKLVGARAEKELADCLGSTDETTATLAAEGLWQVWLSEAGEGNRWALEAGILSMEAGELDQAESVFAELMANQPQWAEATNKLATVLYMKGEFARSADLCRQVVETKPWHFGAWSGLAMCEVQLENWQAAREAVAQALRLQPGSAVNQALQKQIAKHS